MMKFACLLQSSPLYGRVIIRMETTSVVVNELIHQQTHELCQGSADQLRYHCSQAG